MDALNTFKKYLNEEELPEFNNFQKQILKYGLGNVEYLQPGDQASEVADALFNRPEMVTSYYEGITLLSNYNDANSGEGWTGALEYLFERGEDFGMSESLSENIKDAAWDSLASLLIYWKGEELLVASEILGQKFATGDEEMDAEDIQDLENELELFIG